MRNNTLSQNSTNAREDALERIQTLDPSSGRVFELATHLARLHYQVDMAFFSLIDESRQWIKASQGVDDRQFDRLSALCDVLVKQDHPLIVPDIRQAPQFKNASLATDQPLIRFYAGVPIREPNGFAIGTLCIGHTTPRQLRSEDLEALVTLAGLIENHFAGWVNAHQESRQDQILSQSIGKVQHIFLTTDDDNAAFDALLADLLKLTGCAFGFVGEVLQNDSGQLYVEVRAATNIAWNEETARLYSQVKTGGLVFENLDNLIGAAVLARDVVISEDVATDPRRGGTGHGHPPIKTYMGIPIFAGRHLVGLIGLANSPGGFSREMARDLEPLTRTVGALIERKRFYAERARHHDLIEREAQFDILTGLPNRRLLNQLFDEKMSAVATTGGSLSICFIDLDGFKAVNDTHGHAVGDTVLKAVASRLAGVIRAGDVIARLSGDEFVAILLDVSHSDVYQRMLERIEEPVSYKGQLIRVSGSMGITIYPADYSERDILLRHADQAMYAAKQLGKNKMVFFDVVEHRSRRERHRLLDDFKRALSENELELFYQPKIDLVRRKVMGFEVLIRWHHPEEGLVMSARFLPALAYTEQEIRLGEYVIAEGIKTIQHFSDIGADYSLNINISAQHILNDGFLEYLEKKISLLTPALSPRLYIEVLESMALQDMEWSINILEACKRLGVNLSLDDFGTGFSSLTYFRKLPVDEIKIDKSFVKEILNDEDDRLIVQNIINLAKGFRRKAVAEGIESLAVAEELVEMGCEWGQGYHFTCPLPLEEALNWARKFERS